MRPLEKKIPLLGGVTLGARKLDKETGNRTAAGRRRTRAVWVVPPEERPTNDQEEGTHRAEEDECRYRAG